MVSCSMTSGDCRGDRRHFGLGRNPSRGAGSRGLRRRDRGRRRAAHLRRQLPRSGHCHRRRPRDPIASRRFDDLVREASFVIEPVTEAQARIARDAYRDFGKGSGHPAQLNFGDCFAYALARAAGEPLLFKGTDFSHTDITRALS
jgi:uncharacterized protein with PIN domain